LYTQIKYRCIVSKISSRRTLTYPSVPQPFVDRMRGQSPSYLMDVGVKCECESESKFRLKVQV